jgi:hypothetical protein
MRGWRRTAGQKKLAKAYRRGFEALRQDLLGAFRRIGKGEMNGYTALEIVKNAKIDVRRETFT